MDRLSEALDRDTAEIEASLDDARRERDLARSRERELTELIERAEALLGYEDSGKRRTLHEAITLILSDQNNEWMHTRDIATEVNQRRLYQKRDGSPVEPNQIHARSKNYSHVFEKEGPLVRLRTEDSRADQQQIRPRSKYDALHDRLESIDGDSATMSFEEIDLLVGTLPRSAWNHQAWWANERIGSHVQARSWLAAGFRVNRVDQNSGRVWFEREATDENGTAAQ